MKQKQLSDAIGKIDAAYVEEALTDTARKPSITWLRRGIPVVAAAVVIAVVAWQQPWNTGFAPTIPNVESTTDDKNMVSVGGVPRFYCNRTVQTESIALIYPWEYLTLPEQYVYAAFQTQTYHIVGRDAISDTSQIGESLGSCIATGTDSYTDQTHSRSFEVYAIRGIATECMVALHMDGSFYPYAKDEYDPPATLGEWIEQYSLPDYVQLERFSQTDAAHTAKEYFHLSDDTAFWEQLLTCKDAPFTEFDPKSRDSVNKISFTITSEVLGVYKRGLHITADGYLSTNLMFYGYAFYIGEETAAELIAYATANAEPAFYEPYYETVAGTLIEIGEDYLLIDDGILCETPSDGMVFRVPTTDLRIRRTLLMDVVTVGDTVQLSFTGTVDTAHDNQIDHPVFLQIAHITENGELYS